MLSHEISVFVYYEDTDFSGFVYHANYLKFFERGREHLIGIDYLREQFKSGIHFVVAKCQMEFHRPAAHGDQLIITTDCHFSRSPMLHFNHKAYRINTDGQRELLVSASVQAACLNAANRPTRLPQNVMTYFSERRFDNDGQK